MRWCLCGRAQLNFVYSTCHGAQKPLFARTRGNFSRMLYAMERERKTHCFWRPSNAGRLREFAESDYVSIWFAEWKRAVNYEILANDPRKRRKEEKFTFQFVPMKDEEIKILKIIMVIQQVSDIWHELKKSAKDLDLKKNHFKKSKWTFWYGISAFKLSSFN